MLSEYEARIHTRARQNNLSSKACPIGPRPAVAALGPTLVALALLVVDLWPKGAEPGPAAVEQPGIEFHPEASTASSRRSEPETSQEFLFGFLEFDRDLNRPGVSGFASWSPEAGGQTPSRVPRASP
jgi:hypothetical protein